jgi:adenylylsulfate kinase
MIETGTRSFLKAVSWRVCGSLATMLIAYILTRDTQIALFAGGLDAIFKIVLFFLHERMWNKIHFGKKRMPARIIWFTGLPASGKTTLAKELVSELKDRKLDVEHLDGDEIRNIFPSVGFDWQSRDQHIRRVGHLASRLQSHNVWVVVSLVSPIRESREFVRGISKDFVEVYLDTPLEECQKRDPKGLYRKAQEGEMSGLTGAQEKYEAPLNPELKIDTSKTTLKKSTKLIIDLIFS